MEYSTIKTMKSILTEDTSTCFVSDCGCKATDCHHVFEGKNKTLSERDMLLIPMCHKHHMEIHRDPEMNKYFKGLAQLAWEKKIGPRPQFIKLYGKNYIEEPECENEEIELDEYSHPGVMSQRHKEIETCVGVPIEEHTEMHRRKNY